VNYPRRYDWRCHCCISTCLAKHQRRVTNSILLYLSASERWWYGASYPNPILHFETQLLDKEKQGVPIWETYGTQKELSQETEESDTRIQARLGENTLSLLVSGHCSVVPVFRSEMRSHQVKKKKKTQQTKQPPQSKKNYLIF